MRRQAHYRPIAFAGPLYKIVARQYSVTISFLHDRDSKERPSLLFGGASPRRLLQAAGDALRKRDGEDVLIRQLRARIEAEPSVRFVITDLRLPIEADAVRAMGGQVAKVLWPVAANHPSSLQAETDQHRTEANDFRPDFTVVNSGTPEEVVGDLFNSLTAHRRSAWQV
jgi:hypothetical protein